MRSILARAALLFSRKRTKTERAWHEAAERYRRAVECSRCGDWTGAISGLEAVLAAVGSGPLAWKAWSELATAYAMVGRADDVAHALRQATAVARTLEPNFKRSALRLSLGREASLHAREGRITEALECLDKILAQCDDSIIFGPPSRVLVARARLLLNRGEIDSARCDLDAARRHLEANWPIVKPAALSTMKKCPASVMSDWWLVTSWLRYIDGDRTGALTAANESLVLTRLFEATLHFPEAQTQVCLAQRLSEYAAFCETLGETQRADEARAEAAALRHKWNLPEL